MNLFHFQASWRYQMVVLSTASDVVCVCVCGRGGGVPELLLCEHRPPGVKGPDPGRMQEVVVKWNTMGTPGAEMGNIPLEAPVHCTSAWPQEAEVHYTHSFDVSGRISMFIVVVLGRRRDMCINITQLAVVVPPRTQRAEWISVEIACLPPPPLFSGSTAKQHGNRVGGV